jgi:4-hydroxyphenylpyruvate dioxygenase-like putative hemolysin
MSVYKVERVEAEKFAKVWNKGGITIILSAEALDFATDFSNVVLNNFIGMCQAQATQAAAKAAEAQKPKIILEGIN